MSKPKRLSGLGHLNYRNIGLGFTCNVLTAIQSELDPKCKVARDVTKALEAIRDVFRCIPNDLTGEEIAAGGKIFEKMELCIIKQIEYDRFLHPDEIIDRDNMIGEDDALWEQPTLF